MSKLFLSQDEVNKTIEELRATMKGLGTDDKVYIIGKSQNQFIIIVK